MREHSKQVDRASDATWWFCDSQNCDVVYFSDRTTFTSRQVAVTVGVKEKTGERPLCYCFGHSIASIKKELAQTGQTTVLQDIRHRMNEAGCSCETRNPSGACCLGNVAGGIDIAKAELGNVDGPVTSTMATTAGHGTAINSAATLGMVLSAVMSSSCCWLPLLLLMLGVSGAGVAAILEQYRAYFATATFGFLGIAFYVAYRPSPSREGDSCCPSDSETPAACASDASSNSRRASTMQTVNRASLWAATAIAAAFLLFPSYLSVLDGSEDNPPAATGGQQLTIHLDGLTCEGCAAAAGKAINSVPGVEAVRVDYEKRTAVVSTKSRCDAPRDEILAAIKKAGFEGSVAEVSNETRAKAAAKCCTTGCESCNQAGQEIVANTIDPDLQAVFQVGGLRCRAVRGVGCGHRLAPVFRKLVELQGVQAMSTNWTGTELRLVAESTSQREQATKAVLAQLKSAGYEPVRLKDKDFAKALHQKWWDSSDVDDLSAHEFETVMNSVLRQYAQREDLDTEATEKLLKINEQQWKRWKESKVDREASHAAQWSSRLAGIGKDVLVESAKVLKPDQAKDLQEVFGRAWRSLQIGFDEQNADSGE